jgi:hypothetical protein
VAIRYWVFSQPIQIAIVIVIFILIGPGAHPAPIATKSVLGFTRSHITRTHFQLDSSTGEPAGKQVTEKESNHEHQPPHENASGNARKF